MEAPAQAHSAMLRIFKAVGPGPMVRSRVATSTFPACSLHRPLGGHEKLATHTSLDASGRFVQATCEFALFVAVERAVHETL